MNKFQMNKIPEKTWIITGLIITGIAFLFLAFLSEIPAGGADNYAHFNISHWAFRYPQLFLDHWGKPLYTILAAPIAQFGFVAVRILNSVLGLLTAWYIWKLAKLFRFNFSWFAAVVAIFTPIYFAMMSTGMTEILFSFVLVVSVYQFFKEKYILSAILISFIFLVRTEGLAFLLPFAIAFVLKKQYKVLPFLITGFLVFSVIGWLFYYHDFFWLITKRPYANGGPSVYGNGKWYHFIKHIHSYYGVIAALFLFSGTIFIAVNWIRSTRKLNNKWFFTVLLILGTFWGYFFIHSFLWWKGVTSAGLDRVMAGVSPLIGIIALFIIEFAGKYISQKYVKVSILIGLSGFLVFNSVAYYHRSANGDLTAEVKNRVTEWLKDSGNLRHKLIMHDPYFAFSTEIDAWDLNVVQYGFSDNNKAEVNLPDSVLFIWDAQFAANEGNLPVEKLLNNPNFEIVKIFEPEIPFRVLGDYDYRIVVFRLIHGKNQNHFGLVRNFQNIQEDNGVYYSEKYDFEKAFSEKAVQYMRTERADSSGHAFNLNNHEFSPAFSLDIETLNLTNKNILHVSSGFRKIDTLRNIKLLMVFSVEKNNKSDHYETRNISEQITKYGVWNKTDFTFNIPDSTKSNSTIKLYVWNVDRSDVLMDNFELEISKQTKN